jgi:hypothetical protein
LVQISYIFHDEYDSIPRASRGVQPTGQRPVKWPTRRSTKLRILGGVLACKHCRQQLPQVRDGGLIGVGAPRAGAGEVLDLKRRLGGDGAGDRRRPVQLLAGGRSPAPA